MRRTERNWTISTSSPGGHPSVVLQLFTDEGKEIGGISRADEAEVDQLITTLKQAKAAAWPKVPQPLCPSSKELLSYLKQHGNVTPIKAREELGIEHLPRRIKDLKEHGYTIRTERKRGYARKLYAKYTLETSSTGDAK